MSGRSKNDVAWEILFESHHILESVEKQGFFEISSAAINILREARLMTKFYLKQAARPTTDEVMAIMRAAHLELDLAGTTTIARRAHTVLAWIDWMMRLTRR